MGCRAHIGDPEEAPDSWLQPGTALGYCSYWMTKPGEISVSVCLFPSSFHNSAFQINKILKKKTEFQDKIHTANTTCTEHTKRLISLPQKMSYTIIRTGSKIQNQSGAPEVSCCHMEINHLSEEKKKLSLI